MSMDAIKPQMLRTFGFLALLAAACELVLLTFLGPHRGAAELWDSVAGGEFTRWLVIFWSAMGGTIAVVALTRFEYSNKYPGLITGTVLTLLFTYLMAASR